MTKVHAIDKRGIPAEEVDGVVSGFPGFHWFQRSQKIDRGERFGSDPTVDSSEGFEVEYGIG